MRKSRDEKLVQAFELKHTADETARSQASSATNLSIPNIALKPTTREKIYEQIRMGSTSTILNNYVFVSIALVVWPCLMLLLILLCCNSIVGERKLLNGNDVGDEQMLNES